MPSPGRTAIRNVPAAADVDSMPLPRVELNVVELQSGAGDLNGHLIASGDLHIGNGQRGPAAGRARRWRFALLAAVNQQRHVAAALPFVKVPQIDIVPPAAGSKRLV